MQSLILFILVATCQAQIFFNNDTYKQTPGGSSDCGAGYQEITDVKACEEVAESIMGKEFGAVFHRYPVNPFPNYCTTNSDAVNYFINPMGVHTDPAVSVLCISSNKTCDVTDGSGMSSEYPCVCGTDTCATGEICKESANVCEVYKGYIETERKGKSCPTGYQTITDATACMELAGIIPGKRWGAVYDYHNVPHGCSSWTSGIVNYYVNQGGSNEDVDVGMLCINSSMKCDVSDGSGVSSSYPCACGTDTCASGEVCVESSNKCELIKGIYQTERKDSACPTGYQAIDKASCYALAPMLMREWMPFMDYSGPAYGCGSWNFDTVNFFDYPGGGEPASAPTNVESAILCMKDTSVIPIDLGNNMYHPSYNPV